MKALWLALALVPLAPTVADACSPPPCWPGAFVPRDAATVPANLPGIVWQPMQGNLVGEGTADPASVTLVDADAPGTPIAMTYTANTDGTYTFVPTAQLTPGKHYTLADATQCTYPGTTFTTPPATFAAAAVAPLPTTLGTTFGTPQGVTDVSVLTLTGSCDATVTADVVDLQVALAADAMPWQDALMYATTVDGQPWHPQSSVAGMLPPGTSWTGRGTDRVFEACSGGDETTDRGVAAGTHLAQLHASLPGTTLALDAAAAHFDLSCDAANGSGDLAPDGGDVVSPDHGNAGGCLSAAGGGTGAGAFALVGLALLVSSASGRRARRRR